MSISSPAPVSPPAPAIVLSAIKVGNTTTAVPDARVDELRASGQIAFNEPKG